MPSLRDSKSYCDLFPRVGTHGCKVSLLRSCEEGLMPSLRDSNLYCDLTPRVGTRGFRMTLLRSCKKQRPASFPLRPIVE